LRGEYTEEAELRRNAAEMLDEYMIRHNIESDGYKFDDENYTDSSDDENVEADSSPPRKREKSEKPAKKSPKRSTRQKRGKKRRRKN